MGHPVRRKTRRLPRHLPLGQRSRREATRPRAQVRAARRWHRLSASAGLQGAALRGRPTDGLPAGGNDAPVAAACARGISPGQPVAGRAGVLAGALGRAAIIWTSRSSGEDTAMRDWPVSDLPGVHELDDAYSEHARAPSSDDAEPPETKGEARLDARGEASSARELPKNLHGARYEAHWEIAVTSADGQSVAAGIAPTRDRHAPAGAPWGLRAAGASPGQADGAARSHCKPRRALRLPPRFDAQDHPTRTPGRPRGAFPRRHEDRPRECRPFCRALPQYAAFSPRSKPLPVGEAGARSGAVGSCRWTSPAATSPSLTAPGLRQVSAEIVRGRPGRG